MKDRTQRGNGKAAQLPRPAPPPPAKANLPADDAACVHGDAGCLPGHVGDLLAASGTLPTITAFDGQRWFEVLDPVQNLSSEGDDAFVRAGFRRLLAFGDILAPIRLEVFSGERNRWLAVFELEGECEFVLLVGFPGLLGFLNLVAPVLAMAKGCVDD
jgi:hypothetical protein